MTDFEKLGAFYLGRPYDIDARKTTDGLVLYDSRDLVTHAMVIGMTGSGKTGLGIVMLEEAAIDGVPCLVVDPKGDLPNLLLTFPELSAAEFRPWINEDEAARQGVAPDAYAAQQAETWKRGLAGWGMDAARIDRLRKAVDIAIYTPGSTAGIPISILKSFSAPPPEIADDHELLAERIGTTVTSLLTLVGVDADPVRSREHILLSTIVSAAWKAGEDLDLGTLIQRIQKPPVTRIGVLELEAFYPEKDRFALAMQVNGLLAAPSFSTWLEGEPLDLDRLLYTAEGRPRIAILSIAHLGETERMFFVALLLEQVLSWVRRQQGTTSLRAMLYMDEVQGYMPPVAVPPSKPPLLTLLKQARAYGLGVVLATQNPGDLDYKGLSNLGTWMIGRLQTERDKSKVLEGLEGALAGSGRFDRGELDRMLSGLGKRVFLMHDVHEDGPQVFETRWALSYLRGPVTRDQIRQLMAGRKPAAAAVPAGTVAESGRRATPPPARGAGLAVAVADAAAPPSPATIPGRGVAPGAGLRPVLPPDIVQVFTGEGHYVPHVLATGQVQFSDAKLGLSEAKTVTCLVPIGAGPVPLDWDSVEETDLRLADLPQDPESGATFDELPAVAGKAKSYSAWQKDFGRWLGQTQSLELVRDADTGLVSKPGESERDFRIRLQVAFRERRDRLKEDVRRKYAPKVAALQEKERRAQQAIQREEEQASAQKWQAGLSVVSSVFGAVLGRKVASASNVGRAATAARSIGRTMKESSDVSRATENLQAVQEQLHELETEMSAETAALEAAADPLTVPLEKVALKPKRGQIAVQQVVLAWVGR